MNLISTIARSMATVLAFATIVPSVQSQTLEQIERNQPATFVDGVESYIYGYPLLMFGVTGRTATTVPDATTKLGGAPLNQFGKEMRLPDATFTSVVLPSTTTLYASSFLNLSAEPVILHIPYMGNRFFLLQMLDGWTNVSTKSPGSRQGSQEGDYALVGPDFKGQLPFGLRDTIQMPTNSMWIIGRIYTNGTTADVRDVVQFIYPGLTLTPLSRFRRGPYTPPDDLPIQPLADVITTPLNQVAGMDACAFFQNMAAVMMYNKPIPGQDDAILPRLAGVGLFQDRSFDCTAIDKDQMDTLQQAVIAARTFLNIAPTPPPTSTKWTLSLGVGDYGNNYLLRAEVAKDALGANNPSDAVYGYTTTDGSGANLDGAHSYKIHFAAPGASEGIPPVNPKGFWSVTIYNANGTLVANEAAASAGVNYNAIGVPYVQGHMAQFNMDGSLDLYLQSTAPPAGTAFKNWLPTPTSGNYIVFLRAYWPDPAILNGSWIPPAIMKTN
jgi:hypothetical protein